MNPYLASLIEIANKSGSGVEQYKTLISLQCHATPAEWQEFAAATDFGARGTADFQKELRILHELMFRNGAAAQPYMRVLATEGVSHYRGTVEAGKMLIAFTGRALGLFGPIARVLQYFPADDYEVLILRDDRNSGFTEGVSGQSSSFMDMIDGLRRQFLADRDRDLLCLGASGGGAPALVAAALLSAKSGVSFAGRPPTTSKIYGKSAGAVIMESMLRHLSPNAAGQLHAVYAAEYLQDATNAKILSEIAPVKLWPIAGLSGHAVLHDLDLRGELADVLRSTGLLY